MQPKTRILIYAIAIASLLGIFMLTTVSTETSKVFYQHVQIEQDNHMRIAWNVLNKKGLSFQIRDGRLVLGNILLNGDQTIVDEIGYLTQETVSIFHGNVCIATTLRNAD